MANSQPPLSAGERFAIAVGAFLRALLRLIIVVLAGAILAGLLYMGFVLIYQQAILPARENASRLSLLETRQASQSSELNQRLEELQRQITEMGNQIIVLQNDQAGLKREMELVQSTQQAYPLQFKRITDLEKRVSDIQKVSRQALELAQKNQQTLQSGELLRAVEYQLTVLKSALLIQRARLYLNEANLGLAREEIRAARLLLVELQATANENQQAELAAWLGRIDSALANLPERPVLAASDLEAVENLILLPRMIEGTSLAPLAFERTPTPASLSTISPTPAGTLTPTATFARTPSPTP
ncbi:MAG: hypothetical protein AB1522_02980 [Chloroflexota bacterium]